MTYTGNPRVYCPRHGPGLAPARIGWGHSSISATVEVALEAQVGTLAFFHHDPLHDDPEVAKMAEQAIQMIGARNSSLHCFAAREGQTLDV